MKSEIAGTLVEWDETKNQQNIKKHGISFQTAALVFADEERIEYLDKLHSQDEERYVILGCVQGILYVVYTMRDEYARLISARMATSYKEDLLWRMKRLYAHISIQVNSLLKIRFARLNWLLL